MKHTIPERLIEYSKNVNGKFISQHNYGSAGILFANWRDTKYIEQNLSVIALFRLRNFKVVALLLSVALFASCTKHNDVQFTTFSGQPAVNYTVVVEAQQANAASIWSPTSSITLPK